MGIRPPKQTKSWFQVENAHKHQRMKALNLVKEVRGTIRHGASQLDGVIFALLGKKVNFDKVIKMIDETRFGREQKNPGQSSLASVFRDRASVAVVEPSGLPGARFRRQSLCHPGLPVLACNAGDVPGRTFPPFGGPRLGTIFFPTAERGLFFSGSHVRGARAQGRGDHLPVFA